MAAIATINSVTEGHEGYPPVKADQDEPWFTVNGQPILVEGDAFLPHTYKKSTHTGMAASSRPWFTVGGKGVVCVGDALTCGDHVATGDSSIQIG